MSPTVVQMQGDHISFNVPAELRDKVELLEQDTGQGAAQLAQRAFERMVLLAEDQRTFGFDVDFDM